MKNFKILLPFTVFSLLFVGCSEKSFHDEMINKTKQSFDKKEYDDIKQSYSDALVDEKFKNKDSINVYEKEKEQNEVIKKALINYLFHNTKHLLFSSFAYALYKNSFDCTLGVASGATPSARS